MKIDSTDSIPRPAREAIERASEATGVDFALLMETARRESSFNATARAPTSSATGLFQFIESTWLETVRRHGAKHGLDVYASQIEQVNGRPTVRDTRLRQQILDLRYDPEMSARMGAELAKDNAALLERRLGRAPSAGEIYAAHVLGVGGATKLIAAAEQGAPSAADLFPREAAANRWLFHTRDGRERSAEALLARLDVTNAGTVYQTGPLAVQMAAQDNRMPPARVEGLRGLTVVEPLSPEVQAQREAATMMAQMLIETTRAGTMALFNDSDAGASGPGYALGAYRRMAS